ncbi:lysylphosphatidylglycerol synthase domain-containing protein [Microbacterium sp. gxy059]|uniref:lysylphosphatidylglycerol synthase domain-containing protein n=1 Tax=Microbacterium sp. gxy059 TaxID=2957199 RepID=UPI003D97042A
MGDVDRPGGERATKAGWRRRALRWGATTAIVGVVGWLFATALIDNWDALRDRDLRPDGWWALAIAAFAAAVPVTGLSWGRIVRVLEPDARVSAREAIAVQCLSWVLKYIPGQVGSVANKVLWAKKKGISRTLIVITFIYENVFLQLASIVPAVIILFVSLGPRVLGENATTLIAPLLVLIPVAAVLYAPLFHRIVALPAKKILKRDIPREYFLSSGQALRSAIAFLGPRIVNGVGFVAIAVSVSGISPAEWLPFAAAYALAGAVGILAFLVPSGLGVREAVIVAVLSQYIPLAEAIVISLIARLLSTVGDALVALIYVIVRRTIPKEIRP